ncbi:DUF6344 domain-containing protein [Streptomyces sp. NPDC004609]|uniref:DUF6344 domain-containing protein n=1 Tax=Streptomyces sp. NPDC004609 TaxID=3364704 RepID=UPI0036742873
MTCAKVRNLWSALLGALVALLASLGLTGSAAAQQAAVRTPDESAQPEGAVKPQEPAHTGRPVLVRQERERERAARALLPALVPAQSTRWNTGARDRSLPPTIKQRIRAEAHGASPSVRKVPAFDLDGPLTVRAAEAVADRALRADRSRVVDRAVVPGGVRTPDSFAAGDTPAAMDRMLTDRTSGNSRAPEGRTHEDGRTPDGSRTAMGRVPAHNASVHNAPVHASAQDAAPAFLVPAQDAPVSVEPSADSGHPRRSEDERTGATGLPAAPPAFAPLYAVPVTAAVSSSDARRGAPDRALASEHEREQGDAQRRVTHLAARPVRDLAPAPGTAAHPSTADLAAA